LIGRILMGGFFLWNGIEATLNFESATMVFASVKMPHPEVFAMIAIAIEVVCGILLVVGTYTRPAAITLSVFVFSTSLLHPGTANSFSQMLFLQDMAIIGGLLYISAYGSGFWSNDWKYTVVKKPEKIERKPQKKAHKKR
jgi:putative oxidoreductase